MRFRNLAVFSFSAALALGGGVATGQGIITGSITGTVQDPTGAVIPGATIVATAAATGISQKATANGSGDFSLSNLPVGVYQVVISGAGFTDIKLSNVVVSTGQANGLGVEKLNTGGAVETVQVNSGESLLETTQAQVSTTFDSEQIQNLPTGGGFDELALLIPGVVSTRSNNFSNTNGAGISSNGQRGRSNNFELDGQSNNDNSVAGPQVFFQNSDALAEVQIITDNFSAQYGRDAGSVVNYITKSGTNAFHGTAFEYYEGSWLTSLTQGQKGPQFGYCTPAQVASGANTTGACVLPHKPRFTDNEFGGTFGGPIIKDKLFGFGSALFQRNISGQTILNSGTVGGSTGYTPTAAGIAALAAAFPNNPGVQSLQAYGPLSLSGGSAGTVQTLGSPHTVTVSNGTTSAAVPVTLYSRTISPSSTDEEVLGRLDYQATPRDRFYFRYFYQTNPSNPYNQTVTGGIVNLTDKVHSVGADWTHTFTPHIVNQLRYSFQQSSLLFQGGAFPNCTTTNFAGCPSSFTINANTTSLVATDGQKVSTAISSFGLSTSYPQGRVVKDTQIQDNLTLTYGRHTMTMGGSYEFQNSPNVFLPNLSGGFTFTGEQGLLSQSGSLGLAIGNPSIHFTEPDVAAYFQDDWKATPSLTLNLGMRWEFFSQSINLLHNISAANQTGSRPLWDTTLPTSVTEFPQIPQDYKHFEPRLGFAYNPEGMKPLVVRGGYSINIAPAFYNIFLNSYGSAPVVLANTVACGGNCIPTGGANYSSVHAQDNPLLLTIPSTSTQKGLNPGSFSQTFVGNNFKQPLTQTYSLGVQYQVKRIGVAEVRYVGVHTSGDFQSVNANPKIAAAAAAFPGYFGTITPCAASTLPAFPVLSSTTSDVGRLHCGSTNVRDRVNTSFDIYNGLQTSFKTSNYHGLTADLSYTFSRAIDNASEIFSTDTAGSTSAFSENPLDPNFQERAVSGNSFPNVTSLGLTYVDPHFRQNHSLVGKALGGFQLNVIYLFNSGQPYNDFQLASEGSFGDSSFNTAFNGSVDSSRPVLSNPKAPLGTAGKNCGSNYYIAYGGTCFTGNNAGSASPAIDPNSVHWLINNVAQAITLGRPYPGVGRNTLRGDSYNNVQASVFKNNKINEHLNLQLQVTAFNALNRAYYGSPDPELEHASGTTPTFNNFVGNTGSNRNVQIGARMLF